MGDDSERMALIAAASDWHGAEAERALCPHARIVRAATVEEALSALRAHGVRFDAVVLDLGMRRTRLLTQLRPLDVVRRAQPGALIAAWGGRHDAAEWLRRLDVLWAADAQAAAMRIARWWHIPASVPHAEARVAEELGSEIGVTVKQMTVLALTVADCSESAIAAELRVSGDTVNGYRARIARLAGQASLAPLARRARMRAVGEPVELLPTGWRSARKYAKRERERERARRTETVDAR